MSDGTGNQSAPTAEHLQALHMMNFARGMENNQRTLDHAQAMGEAQLKQHFGSDFQAAEHEDMNFAYNSPNTVHNHYQNPLPPPAPLTPPPAPLTPPPAPLTSPPPTSLFGNIVKTLAVVSAGGAAGAGLMLASQLLNKQTETPPSPQPPPVVIEKPIAPAPTSDLDTRYKLTLPKGKQPDVSN